jgi:uncharacterized membrane protein
MKSRATFLGHPVHQMLIVFPLGLLATSVIFDLIFLATANPTMNLVAWWMLTAGIVGAFVAIPFGLIDWGAIPGGTRAKRIGLLHGVGNLIVSLLFIISWVLRQPDVPPPTLALVCGFVAVGLALVTAWLGGELVSRLAVGVYDEAGLNASNSLSAEARAESAEERGRP